MFRYQFLKKAATIVLVMIMATSCVIEPEAATGSTIKLFGIHDESTMFNHTDDLCMWMKAGGSYYRKADPTATIKKKHYARASSVYASLKGSDYIVIRTRGNSNGITFLDKDGDRLTDSTLSVTDIKNGAALNRLKVCFVGSSYSSNIAKAIYEKGTKTTIGYTTNVTTSFNTKLIRHFNKNFTSGKSVSMSLYEGKLALQKKFGSIGNVDHYVIYGLTNQVF